MSSWGHHRLCYQDKCPVCYEAFVFVLKNNVINAIVNYFGCWGGSPDQVVLGDDLSSRGHGLKSQHRKLCGHFSHWCFVKIVLFVCLKRRKINKKRLGMARLKKFGCHCVANEIFNLQLFSGKYCWKGYKQPPPFSLFSFFKFIRKNCGRIRTQIFGQKACNLTTNLVQHITTTSAKLMLWLFLKMIKSYFWAIRFLQLFFLLRLFLMRNDRCCWKLTIPFYSKFWFCKMI